MYDIGSKKFEIGFELAFNWVRLALNWVKLALIGFVFLTFDFV